MTAPQILSKKPIRFPTCSPLEYCNKKNRTLINNKEIIIPICMSPTLSSKPTVIKLNKVQN